MTNIIETDILVIGEGSAGQVAALAANEAGADVVLLFNGQASSTAISTGFLTYAAHDGFPQDDVFDAMSEVTGKGLCDTALLRRLVDDAPAEMGAIIAKYDIPVDRAPRGFRVRRSTGMRGKDILEDTYGADGAEDMTGLMMEFSSTHGTALFSQLRKAVKASTVRRIRGSALSLHRDGPSVWADIDGEPVWIAARAVILATGGMQGVYEFTDTPQNLLGDGQSMALEAGAELVDMEFIQFYPLAVNEEGAPAIFLYPDYPSTAKLVNSDDEDLILKHMGPGQSALAALHNWDFLSFIIQSEIISGREVFIDFRDTTDQEWAPDSLTATFLSKHVPDYRSRPVRISPSSHYTIGGVRVDADGQTTIPGVYAVGEVAGGVHGANRHGGTALVEAMTFGAIAGRHAAANLQPRSNMARDTGNPPAIRRNGNGGSVADLLARVRQLTQSGLGPARNAALLDDTLEKLRALQAEIAALGWADLGGFAEARRLARVARLSEAMCLAMSRRRESRGTHMRSDFPEEMGDWRRKQAVRLNGDALELHDLTLRDASVELAS
ncbi:FAD-binding protein [Roseovarius sp. CAU 1744]|uniref:FAD-binding protein n=1 Tax=Roseovarius sp. CAU 1744 TaxID=3140368 RepID=UPI00325AE02E